MLGDASGAVVGGIFFFLVFCAVVWEVGKAAWKALRERIKRP